MDEELHISPHYFHLQRTPLQKIITWFLKPLNVFLKIEWFNPIPQYVEVSEPLYINDIVFNLMKEESIEPTKNS